MRWGGGHSGAPLLLPLHCCHMLEPGVSSSVICLQQLPSWEVPSVSPSGVSNVHASRAKLFVNPPQVRARYLANKVVAVSAVTAVVSSPAVCSRCVMSSFTWSHVWQTEESRSPSPFVSSWETNVSLERPAKYDLVLITWERGRQLNWRCLQSS